MNQHIYQRRPAGNSAIPDVIFVLLIANGLVWAAQHWQLELMYGYFALWPLDSRFADFMPWQLLTYGFMHDVNGINHILFNMFGLWRWGRDLERSMGAQRFLT